MCALSVEELVASNVQIQFRHAQGNCSCLLPHWEQCLYQLIVPDHDADVGEEAVQGGGVVDEAQEEEDANWNPLREFVARPGYLYTVQMILQPVLNYLQEIVNQLGHDVIIQDYREFVIHFYEFVWTPDM